MAAYEPGRDFYKISEVAEQQAHMCATTTKYLRILRNRRLAVAKCETSATTHHTRLLSFCLGNLGFFSYKVAEKHLCRFLRACTRKNAWVLFLNPRLFITIFIDIWILPLANPFDICPSCASPFDIFSLSLKFDMRHSARENKKPRYCMTPSISSSIFKCPLKTE